MCKGHFKCVKIPDSASLGLFLLAFFIKGGFAIVLRGVFVEALGQPCGGSDSGTFVEAFFALCETSDFL